jgi:hypothetical protein
MKIQIEGITIEPTAAPQSALSDLAWSVLPHFLSYLASKQEPQPGAQQQQQHANNGAASAESVAH